MPRFDLSNYVTVQQRIVEFWKDHPNGRIETDLMSDPSDFTVCRYKASVYRSVDDDKPAATGWAFEHAGGQGANQTSHEENAETSSIGRALANLGYATSQKDRPSREEMDKANRPAPAPQQRQQPRPAAGAEKPVEFGDVYALAREHGITSKSALADYLSLSHEQYALQSAASLMKRLQDKLAAPVSTTHTSPTEQAQFDHAVPR